MSGAPGRRNAVFDLVRRHLPPPARLLEISCGHGELLTTLRDAGYDVRGTNFSRYPATAGAPPVDSGVDWLRGLPYEDASFDGVIAVDVIEHISDHHRAVAEVARVLKPGGCSFLLTPNIMKVSSRLHFLLTGFHKTKREFVGFDVPPPQSFAFHNWPPHLPVFLYELASQGLESEDLAAVRYKPKNFLFALLLLPLLLPLTALTVFVGEKNLRRSGASSLLFRRLMSVPTLCGESLVYVNRRRAPAAAAAVSTPLPPWAERAT
jgi:SAM-dependent methyltransferase